MEVLGFSLFPFLKKLAGTSRWSAVISQALDRCLRWHLTYPCSRCPLLSKKFYIFTDGSHTHTQHTHTPHTHSGRRGTTWHPPSFHVAGVALMALGGALGLAWSPVTPGTPRHFAWQAWHKLTSTVVLRGRRGTTSHPPSFAWQAWHSWHWVARLDWLGRPWRPGRRGTLRGRRGTHGTGWRAWTGLVARDARDAAALCVAGVAQTHIHRRFAWQAWHNLTSTVVLRGRRGTHGTGWRAWTGLVARDARDAAALCVAGVAQTHIHRRFAWQARHNLTSTVVLRGRRDTHGTGWRAWTGLVARDAAALCVAGVAQPDIHLRFTWQAWHSWHWVARLDWLGRPWRPGRRGTLRGRRRLAWSPGTPRHFAWQAWHNLTSTFVSRGRRGTNSHLPSFHVAGVALMALGKWNWSFACKDAVLARGREAGLNCASATNTFACKLPNLFEQRHDTQLKVHHLH